MRPLTIRIIAVQVLFIGLLFLPDYSLNQVKIEAADLSLIIRTLAEILDNPAFYALLMIVAIALLFSLDANAEEFIKDGRISMGSMLVRSLTRVFTVYFALFLLSWFFLVYKLMFMGDIYVNETIVDVLKTAGML